MEFLLITLSNLFWILYSLSDGVREAIYDINKNYSKREINFDSKKLFNIQRGLVLISISLLTIYIIGILSIPFILGQIFIFKYIHNLSYTCTYNKIKGIERKAEIKQDKKNMIAFGITIQIITYLLLF
jgi:hypothetical protein